MEAQGAGRAPDPCGEVRENFLEEEVCRREPPGEGGPLWQGSSLGEGLE